MQWLKDHVWWLGAVSFVTVLLSVILLPLLVTRMPADYFVAPPQPGSWRQRHPLLRIAIHAGKNALGYVLFAIGIVFLALPVGQGILTLLAALALVDFPGKRRLELRLVRMPKVLAAVSWLRSRAGRPPLRLPEEETRPADCGNMGAMGEARTFDHGADIGVLGEGRTIEEAFAGGARAMFSVMVDLDGVRPAVAVEISCAASDRELLLVRWLNALVAEADVRGTVFCEFDLSISDGRLSGTARGERFDPARHKGGVEVKGATLTELSVAQAAGGGWRAQTVVDV
jgi:SHS2 domain-containing protein